MTNIRKIILLDCYQEQVCGVDTYLMELVSAFENNGDYSFLRIILEYPNPMPTIIYSGETEVLRLPLLRNDFGLLQALFISSFVPDLQGSVFMVNFYPCSSLIFNLRKLYREAKIICVVHDYMWALYTYGNMSLAIAQMDDSKRNNVKSSIMDGLYAFSNSDKVVCLSKDSFEIMQTLYCISPSKIHTIPNGMRDLYRIYSDKNIVPNTRKPIRRFIFVGRISRSKGADILLKAFLKVCKFHPDAELIMAGTVMENFELKSDVANPKYKQVKWVGFCSEARLAQLYMSADCGILPSLYEQCPYVGIEMKCYGLPVIATNVMGVRNMFDKNNSIVCEASCDSIFNALKYAMSLSLSEANELRRRSRHDYTHRYSLRSIRKHYTSLFNKCL